MGSILIKGGRVFDGEKLFASDVLTSDEKVTKIAPKINCKADFVFDASGMTVMPGLVDAHVHLRGISPTHWGVGEDISTLPFGVTAVCDAAASFPCRSVIDSLIVKAVAFVPVSIVNNRVDFELTEKLVAALGEYAIGVKIYFDESGGEVRDISVLRDTCRFARDRNLKVMVHTSHSPASMAEIVNELSCKDIITHAYHGGERSAYADGFECLRLARKRGIVIDAGLAGHIHTDFSVFKKAIEAGILPDVISTDITSYSAYVRGGRYGMPMCMSIARALGMDENEIFKAVTSSPAHALGKGNEWGTLKVGGRADIAVINYTKEPFSLTDNAGNSVVSEYGYRCAMTVADGKIVYRD